MEKTSTVTGNISISSEQPETWSPTCNLRWKEVNKDFEYSDGQKITFLLNVLLQQLWTSNKGNDQWREITTEK